MLVLHNNNVVIFLIICIYIFLFVIFNVVLIQCLMCLLFNIPVVTTCTGLICNELGVCEGLGGQYHTMTNKTQSVKI